MNPQKGRKMEKYQHYISMDGEKFYVLQSTTSDQGTVGYAFNPNSGRVQDSRLRGCGFEPHQRYCIVSLSKKLYPLLSTGSTQADPSQHDWKNVDMDIMNQNTILTSSRDQFTYNGCIYTVASQTTLWYTLLSRKKETAN